ncbi:MAG: YdbL family protein [Candidatus Omnitrophota bacterium]
MKRITTLFLAFMMIASSVLLADEGKKYSIKTKTPEVQRALDARKSRFSELHSLKVAGTVGENNRGYVEVLKSDVKAKALVAAENRDRAFIYKTIAQQNELDGELSSIETTFGAVKRERAKSGEMVQTEDGRWVQK